MKLFAVIGILEIVLRNSIDRYLVADKGSSWLENAAMPGGFLYNNPGCEKSVRTVEKTIEMLGPHFNHDDLIARLNFGFWRFMLAPKQFTASGRILLNIFINKPYGINHKTVFRQLYLVNELRNRIAHHEPICFKGNLISTELVESRYRIILSLLHWLGCNPSKILYGIDKVPQAIASIKNI